MILASDALTLSQMAIRLADESDQGLIFSSWLKSYRKSASTLGLTNEIYFDGQREIIRRLLSKAQVRLLVSRDDPSHIYGWACMDLTGNLPVLHYVYIKHTYRKLGLTRLLLSDLMESPVIYSHPGAFAEKLAAGSRFNPYKAIL
jgi:hypothetical protein